MSIFQITKVRALSVGECMSCGAGERGPVSVYVLMLGIFKARLCLNCLKTLRLEIQDELERGDE